MIDITVTLRNYDGKLIGRDTVKMTPGNSVYLAIMQAKSQSLSSMPEKREVYLNGVRVRTGNESSTPVMRKSEIIVFNVDESENKVELDA